MSEDKLTEFLNSNDFMRLGQAIMRKDQSMVMMTVTRLLRAAEEAGVADEFRMNLTGIRQCVMGNNVKQAQDILALVTAKRVKLIESRGNT